MTKLCNASIILLFLFFLSKIKRRGGIIKLAVVEGGGFGCEFCQHGAGHAFLKVNHIVLVDVGVFYDDQQIRSCHRRVFRQLAAV